ncbi:MAG: SPOR domain-containing protein [Yoonia sp.]|uniref:SPOR domain-containing protein n=1 Tax=Yoonia sp. TaxID=2212373 RepID=UPI003EF1D13C
MRPRQIGLAAIAALALAACDENGEFAFPPAGGAASETDQAATAQRVSEQDVERPDIFAADDRGLWDGRPSLGGVWVAHPDVQDPERVRIRNTENDREIIGALFRRERENPGPVFQISSDAAEELGILPGAPTNLSVVVLRREEVVEILPEAETNPVISDLDAPVNVVAQPLEPAPAAAEAGADALAATADAAGGAVDAAADTADAAVQTGALAATAAAATVADTAAATDNASDAGNDVIDVSSVLSATPAPADGPRAQVGVFSVERNANAAVETIQQAGIAATVTPQEMGGRTVWRVVAGPLVDAGVVAQLKELGFVDAFIVEDEQ